MISGLPGVVGIGGSWMPGGVMSGGWGGSISGGARVGGSISGGWRVGGSRSGVGFGSGFFTGAPGVVVCGPAMRRVSSLHQRSNSPFTMGTPGQAGTVPVAH
jgi:hypothetical protein